MSTSKWLALVAMFGLMATGVWFCQQNQKADGVHAVIGEIIVTTPDSGVSTATTSTAVR